MAASTQKHANIMEHQSYQQIHEPCEEVFVRFYPKKRPLIASFVWRGRLYQVDEVSLITKAKKGQTVVWLIHVATARAAFKLRLDTDTLKWWVEELTW